MEPYYGGEGDAPKWWCSICEEPVSPFHILGCGDWPGKHPDVDHKALKEQTGEHSIIASLVLLRRERFGNRT